MKQIDFDTPDAEERSTGVLRHLGALFVDVLAFTLVMMVLLSLLGQAGIELSGRAGWIPGVLVFGYAFLVQRRAVPSLGDWMFALRRHPVPENPENPGDGQLESGKGAVRFIENISIRARALRVLAVSVLLAALFLLFLVL